MKNILFFTSTLALIGFNYAVGQSNLLNAKVPQEVGLLYEQTEANYSNPVEYVMWMIEMFFGQKQFGRLLI
tara:strand:+ start:196 stop:408 length:213 start_codon:yes stop_codon:yes gene_type:complete